MDEQSKMKEAEKEIKCLLHMFRVSRIRCNASLPSLKLLSLLRQQTMHEAKDEGSQ